MPGTRFTILLALSLLVFPVALSAQGSGSTAPLPVPAGGVSLRLRCDDLDYRNTPEAGRQRKDLSGNG